jgi:hypothetical protein
MRVFSFSGSSRKPFCAVSVYLSAWQNVLEVIGYLSYPASDFFFGSSFSSVLRLHAAIQGEERSIQEGLRQWVSIQLPEDLVAHACRPQHLTEGSGIGTTGQQIAAEE